MNIELRKIKVYAAITEETTANGAELFVDGERIAKLANDGKGGCDRVYPVKGKSHNDIRAIEEWVRANVPDRIVEVMPGQPLTIKATLETECGRLVDEFQQKNDLTKLLKRTVVYVVPGSKLSYVKGRYTPEQIDTMAAKLRDQKPGVRILNWLAFDDAFAIYKETAA
jgi:hypothetical protein